MFSCNKFFFPSLNGEQCGNHEISKYLFETSQKIVDEIIDEEY